jgi:maltose O-acetyltransferase
MVNIQPHVTWEHIENIAIGDYSGIGAFSRISARAPVTIGRHVMIGPELVILTSNHMTDRDSIMMFQGFIDKEVVIGNDVWIGTRVTILPGVTIGDGCVIAAGAVVTKNTEPYGIYGGVPARWIRDR